MALYPFGKYIGRQILSSPFRLTNPKSSAANQWFGETNCTSIAGGFTCVISTTLVGSFNFPSVVLKNLPGSSSSAQANFVFGVQTFGAGGFIQFGSVNSVVLAGSYSVLWTFATR